MVIYLFHMLCFLANFFHIFPHLLFIFVLLFPQKLRIYNYINTKKGRGTPLPIISIY